MATTTTSLPRLRRAPAAFDRQVRTRGTGLKVTTVLGWTPGVGSLVSGRTLDCGCLVGVYQMRDGSVLDILDARGPECCLDGHDVNVILDDAREPIPD